MSVEGEQLSILQKFEAIECGCCGIPFAVLESTRRAWISSGEWFYCPNGHQIRYADSETDKLRKELDKAKKRTEWAEHRAKVAEQEAEYNERRRRAEKAAKTRIKNRVGKGVCPCCNRSFENLARHMATKHPGYASED